MKEKLFGILLLLGFSGIILGQNPMNGLPPQSLSFSTGFAVDNYNSLGPAMTLGYLRPVFAHPSISLGLGYSAKYHLIRPATDIYDPPLLNTHSLDLGVYYKLKIWKEYLQWEFYSGWGLMYLSNYRPLHYFQPVFNLGNQWLIKINRKTKLTLSPFSSYRISLNLPYPTYDTYSQFSFFTVGLCMDL